MNGQPWSPLCRQTKDDLRECEPPLSSYHGGSLCDEGLNEMKLCMGPPLSSYHGGPLCVEGLMSFTFRRRWDGGGDDGENFTSPTLSWMATSSTIVSKNKIVSLHFGLHHEFNDQQLCCVHVQVF